MSGRVVITGAGAISPLGDSPARLHEALVRGDSGLAPVELFATDGLSCREAGEVRGFSARAYLGEGNLRPLDRTAQLVASAAQQALVTSGWSDELRQQEEVGLVLGTMFGSVHTISEFDRRALTAGPIYVKPLDFANSVLNAAAGQAAIWHNLRGVNSTVAGGATAALQALGTAADLVAGGRARAVLAGGAEELCFESFYGFHKAGLLAGSANGATPCGVPFDLRRNGFALGEGAALVMLEEEGAARARGATVLGEILGHGSAFDPSRGRRREQAVAAAARAIRLALAEAGVGSGDVGAVSASANGSVDGDRYEALALAAAFGADLERLPITAVKASLGEALGASGALATVAALEAMRSGVLPGIRGLERLDDDLALPGASPTARRGELGIVLINGVGLDGNHCSLVVGRHDPDRPAGG